MNPPYQTSARIVFVPSTLDLTNKQDLGFLSDLIANVRAMVPKIDILLVGATARDLLLFSAHVPL
jgi:hypothetical protein